MLTTKGYLPVYGKIFNSNYSHQPFFYLDPILTERFDKFDKNFIEALQIK